MKRHNKIAFLAVTLLIAALSFSSSRPAHAQASSAPPSAAKRYEAAIEQGRKAVGEMLAKQGIPGMSVAVAVDGELVWSEGFGLADLENRVEVRPHTRFRIGSLSKLLTVAAVSRLYEQGRLDLDAPVQKYVPAFPKKEHEITTRQLAGHLAGIRHYSRDEYINRQRYDSVSESLKIFQDSPLLHAPGSKYSYSTYGYVLLSVVLEGASGQDFLSQLREQVFLPLKLESTVADDTQALIPHRTRFYSRDGKGQLVNSPYTDNSDRLAAGGFLSTAEDLARFASAHLKDDFLKAETRALMFTSQKTSEGKETGVGLGWRTGKDTEERRILHHGGDSLGGRAFLLAYPHAKVVVVMLSNLTFAGFAEKEAAKLAAPFLR